MTDDTYEVSYLLVSFVFLHSFYSFYACCPWHERGLSVFPIFQIRAMFDCHCEKTKAFSKGGNTHISLGERNIGIHFEMAPARQRSLLCSIDGNKDFAAMRRSSDGWLDAASHEEGLPDDEKYC